MHVKVPLSELDNRLMRFRDRMDCVDQGWELAIISSNVNLYYFTGTMQDGMLLVPRDGEAACGFAGAFRGRSMSLPFPQILPMQSYRTRCRSNREDPPRSAGWRPNRYRSPSTSGCRNISRSMR